MYYKGLKIHFNSCFKKRNKNQTNVNNDVCPGENLSVFDSIQDLNESILYDEYNSNNEWLDSLKANVIEQKIVQRVLVAFSFM